jgi:hypothetical protein
MDYTKFYYQYVDVPYDMLDIEKFLSKYPVSKSRFEKIDVNELRELLPSLFSWFNQNDLNVIQIFLINHDIGFKQNIHVDYVDKDGPKLALNIPLTPDSKDAITRVYDLKSGQTSIVQSRGTGTPYSYFDGSQVVLATDYRSIKPVILNITKPHSAWNNTSALRGLLSFRFEKDPEFLIKWHN